VVRRFVLVVVMVGVAYGVGWMSDAVLNDDPCVGTYGREIDTYDAVRRWFPARTDCRVTTPAGLVRVQRGSSEVFLAMFALTLVAGLALSARIRLTWRAAVVVVACVGAFLVIFIF
jgi:hypothetical protein